MTTNTHEPFNKENRMDFIDTIKELSAKIQREIEHINTEEATKTAWVMPFLNSLGYNVFDPLEVVPEFTSDVGIKKGEKVDYCIQKNGEPIILIECKCQGCELDVEHASQLFRYFAVTKVRFAILTNGIIYRFFTDLEQSNVMDSKPFFEFNMLDIKESAVDELKKFSKSAFELDQILATASELKYTREIKRLIAEQMTNPSDEIVKLLAGGVYSGVKTQPVIKQFSELVKRAFQQLITERVTDRLKCALTEETNAGEVAVAIEPASTDNNNGSGTVTTEEEKEAYLLVKAILRGTVEVRRVNMRDAVSYCAIILDDNNRKPICRFHFNTITKKSIGLFDAQKKETRVTIENLDDILNFADQIKATVANYESGQK